MSEQFKNINIYEVIAERDTWKDGFNKVEKERDRLKAELEKPCRQCEAELKKQGELLKDRDHWKSLAMKAKEALEDLHRTSKCYCKPGLEPIGGSGYCAWCEAKEALADFEKETK